MIRSVGILFNKTCSLVLAAVFGAVHGAIRLFNQFIERRVSHDQTDAERDMKRLLACRKRQCVCAGADALGN